MKILVGVFLIFVNSAAYACTCSYSILGNKQVDESSEIFVFRLDSAVADTADADPISGGQVTGNISIVDVLRGKPRIEKMRYSTLHCCGARIDLGQYYVAFVSDGGIEFSGNTGNLLNLGEQYTPGAPTAQRLSAVVQGKESLEQAFGKFPNERMFTLSRPPSPCPNGSHD